MQWNDASRMGLNTRRDSITHIVEARCNKICVTDD